MLINFHLIILIIFKNDTDNKQHIIHPNKELLRQNDTQ